MLAICTTCGAGRALEGGPASCPQCGANETVDEGSAEHTELLAREDELDAGAEPTAAEIREWARAHGVEVADGGPIPQAVLDQFEAAHAGGGEDEKS